MKKNREKNYCRFYIVRHGQTDWNYQGRLQGQTDIPLNREGERQAISLAKKLRKVKFSVAFSSDLLRAKRTAEIIALEKKIAVKTTKALRERYFGRFEGAYWKTDKNYQKLIERFFQLSDKERYSAKPYADTESDEQLMGRLIPFLREVAVAYPGKNVLVVTHGGVMRAFLAHLGYPLPAGSIDNTAYLLVDTDGVDFFVRESSGINFPLSNTKIT